MCSFRHVFASVCKQNQMLLYPCHIFYGPLCRYVSDVLQDSLGGSAYSCMIVNVAPEERHYLDTVSTLKLARKSKKIVNSITVNEQIISKLTLHCTY